MVRCCRSLHSSPSCYNLHRVRVDVRRFRPPGSSAGATGEPAHGTGGPGAPGGPSQLSHRSRFRYRQGVCEMLGHSSGWECVWMTGVFCWSDLEQLLSAHSEWEDNWRISGVGKWASERGLRRPCTNWATQQRGNQCAMWVHVMGLGPPGWAPVTVPAIVFGLIVT